MVDGPRVANVFAHVSALKFSLDTVAFAIFQEHPPAMSPTNPPARDASDNTSPLPNQSTPPAQDAPPARPLKWRGVAYTSSSKLDQDYLQRLGVRTWRGRRSAPSPDEYYISRLQELADSGDDSPDVPPRQGLSLGIKATIFAAILGLVPVLAVGTVAYRAANSSLVANVAEHELDEADQMAGKLSQYLQERLTNIEMITSLIEVLPIYASDLEEPEKARLKQVLTSELTQVVEQSPAYASVGVFDLQGNILVKSAGTAAISNPFETDYFQQVLQTGNPVISDAIALTTNTEGTNPAYAIYLAAPVIGPAGTPTAIVVAQMPLDAIGNTILAVGISDNEAESEEEVYRLVDSTGTILQSLPIDPDRSGVGTSIAAQVPGFAAAQDQRETQYWVGETAQGEALTAYAPVEGLDGLTWSVVNSSLTAEVFAPQQRLLLTIVLGSATTAIAAMLLGIFLAKRTIRPIEQVTEVVERFRQGHLDARVGVKGHDEIAFLGANVNRMARQIQGLLQTLRQNAEQLGVQNDVLAELARNEALVQGDAQGAARAFSEAIARILIVERVSVWRYDAGAKTMTCLTQYHRETSQYSSGLPFSLETTPAYLQALTETPLWSTEAVQQDAIAQELMAQNVLAADTVSLLEMPIRVAGTFAGSVRLEHSGKPRIWRAEEQTFVSSVTNFIALAFESEVLQREVAHLLDVVSAVENGNLATQAQVSTRTTGLVADIFNQLIERLTEVLGQAVETAQQVNSWAYQQISQANLVATNANQQVDGVHQMLQLTDRVRDLAQATADRVAASRTALQTLKQTVDDGQAAMAHLLTDTSVLQEGSDRIIQQMKTLGEFVGLTDQFVQDQTQIASLTQTLALNASLVAARAAEQRDPRQFAVAAREFSSVATQISQLAQQTNDSLTMLEQRSEQIQNVVFTVDASVQRVGSLVAGFSQGLQRSTQAFHAVQQVTEATAQAEDMVVEASQEIVRVVQSTTDVARNIRDMAAQTTTLSEKNRWQSEQMEMLSLSLLETMAFFRLPQSTSKAASRGTAETAIASPPSQPPSPLTNGPPADSAESPPSHSSEPLSLAGNHRSPPDSPAPSRSDEDR
jgi:methyl-accepting chemotaxis protein PixJ